MLAKWPFDKAVLMEAYIPGRELSVAVSDEKPLAVNFLISPLKLLPKVFRTAIMGLSLIMSSAEFSNFAWLLLVEEADKTILNHE